MNHIMIDIETLDNVPSAVILSIAAVEFDPYTGKALGRPYVKHCNIDRQIKAGRTISQSTLFWWMNQGREAREAITSEERTQLFYSLTGLKSWLSKNKDHMIWANSPSFDLVILENAYLQEVDDECIGVCDADGSLNGKLFQKHWLQRDVRTIKQYVNFENFDWPGETDHDALSDCYNQIAIVHAFYKQHGISQEE